MLMMTHAIGTVIDFRRRPRSWVEGGGYLAALAVLVVIGYSSVNALISGSVGAQAIDQDLRKIRPMIEGERTFILGFSLVFIILGTSVGLVGYLLRDQQDILEKVAGVLLIVLGLQLSGIITIPWLQQERRLAF